MIDHSTNRQWAEDISPLCDVREYEMSEKAEPTPGPWVVRECAGKVYFEIVPARRPSDSGLYQIADVCSSRHGLDGGEHIYGGEQEANAHMIAASRDMYEALRACIQYMPEQPTDCGGMKCREEWCEACSGEDDAREAVERAHSELNRARKALRKARGENQ